MTMKRMWINAPSTPQPEHKNHGERVLVDIRSKRGTAKGDIYRVWFADGPVVSSEVFGLYLSDGWPQHPNKPVG